MNLILESGLEIKFWNFSLKIFWEGYNIRDKKLYVKISDSSAN
jgi:hypothetical protein